MCVSNTRPLVSIIMPAYNAEAYIEEAISSVMAQTVSNWELLVIDDESNDNTKALVAALAEKDSRIRLVANQQNMGVAKTRNVGFGLFRGKFVALLDSDYYWKPQMLEKMIARAEETHADIVYCSYDGNYYIMVDSNNYSNVGNIYKFIGLEEYPEDFTMFGVPQYFLSIVAEEDISRHNLGYLYELKKLYDNEDYYELKELINKIKNK